jgi:hypothetical protein
MTDMPQSEMEPEPVSTLKKVQTTERESIQGTRMPLVSALAFGAP